MLQTAAWLILALVHAMPALGFFRPAVLTELYGIGADNPLFLIIRHRAGMFLGVLLACIWAAFDAEARRLGTIVAATSMFSFLALYWQAGSPGALARIARVDLIALPVLAFAGWHAFVR